VGVFNAGGKVVKQTQYPPETNRDRVQRELELESISIRYNIRKSVRFDYAVLQMVVFLVVLCC